VLINKSKGSIICISINKGRRHDFRIYKESKVRIHPKTELLADSGYQGIQKIHSNTIKPIKGTKKRRLTSEDKEHNHKLGSKRVCIEHVIGSLKRFKIVATPYRNRRKRFGLRMNLIAGMINYEL
jgi:hypothetical protein